MQILCGTFGMHRIPQFTAFGLLVDTAHIINGHVPVHRMAGESPVKCGGKVIVIDGGFSKTYRRETGIAAYRCGEILEKR